jgi:hypothetical protein
MQLAQAQDIGRDYHPRFHPIERKKPFVFTPSHDTILKEAISPYHLLTSEQTTRLLYSSGTLKTVKSYLNAMTDVKLTQSLCLPTARGRRPFLYFLGTAGRKTLRDEGVETSIYFEKADLQTRSYGWLMHLLETNDFLISAAILEKSVPGIHLEEWEHDFAIAKNPPTTLNIDGKTAQVHPDGFLHFTISKNGKTKHARFLLELDRGTESEGKLRRKIRDFLVLHDREALQTRFRGNVLTILFATTAGERRVERLRQITREELEAFDKTIGAKSFRNQMFKFAAIPPLMNSPLDPRTLFCEPFWLAPKDNSTNRKVALIDVS